MACVPAYLSAPQRLHCLPVETTQVLHFAATVTPNQDAAFMLAIAWTAVNLLMSNFFIGYDEMSLGWISQVGGWQSQVPRTVVPVAVPRCLRH